MGAREELLKRDKAGGYDTRPRTLITRWDAGGIISTNVPIYVQRRYWGEQINLLPNPPYPYSARTGDGEGYMDVPGRALWWDGDRDVMLIQFPSLAGTGHGGRYDLEDDGYTSHFDEARLALGTVGHGCVFIPTCALDLERMGLEPHVDVHALSQYLSPRAWPTTAMICNLAQYGVQARVMGEMLGVSRQAIHKQLAELPETLQAMVRVYGKGKSTMRCRMPGCDREAAKERGTLCEIHLHERLSMASQYQRPEGWEEGRARAQARRRVNFTARGGIDKWLPDLVNQRNP